MAAASELLAAVAAGRVALRLAGAVVEAEAAEVVGVAEGGVAAEAEVGEVQITKPVGVAPSMGSLPPSATGGARNPRTRDRWR